MARVIGVLTLAVVAPQLGCGQSDPKLEIHVSPNIATGTQSPVRLSNACRGSRNCNSVDLTKVDSIDVANAEVAQVTRNADDDRPGLLYFQLAALSAGSTTINATGTFEDGAQHSASARVRVIDIDRLQVDVHQCSPRATDPLLVQQGDTIEFEISLWGEGQELAGGVTGLVQAEGVRHLSGGVYEFVAPSREAQFPLESALVTDTGLMIETFAAANITRVGLAGFDGARPGEAFGVSTFVEIDGRIPCGAGPAVVTTMTPDVCAGPSGEATWDNSSLTLIVASPVRSGTCRLSVSPEGTSLQSEIEVVLDVG